MKLANLYILTGSSIWDWTPPIELGDGLTGSLSMSRPSTVAVSFELTS